MAHGNLVQQPKVCDFLRRPLAWAGQCHYWPLPGV